MVPGKSFEIRNVLNQWMSVSNSKKLFAALRGTLAEDCLSFKLDVLLFLV